MGRLFGEAFDSIKENFERLAVNAATVRKAEN